MSKLTHEEQIAAIAKVNPDVEVLGKIVNNSTKVSCRCKVCGHVWLPTPNKLKCGRGCPKCGRLKAGPKRLTHEEQVAAITKVNPDIEVTGNIINSKTKVSCRCKVCNHEWSATPPNLKRGTGCPKCAGNAKLTHEEQIAAIAKVNPDVEVLGKIINTDTTVLCRCKVCGHVWLPTPNRLKCGVGCLKCGRLKAGQNRALSHEEQVAAIAEVNPDVEVLGEITRDNKKVLCRCKVCDCKWIGIPRNIKRGNGCPKCARLKRAQRLTLSHEEQITIIAKVNPDVEVLGKIINNSTKVLCFCNVHKIEFLMSPEHLKQGQGCKKCRYSKMAQKRMIPHEEQVAAIAKVNPDVEVLGKITGCDKKVLCRCKICGHEWPARPSDLKSGRGCPKCAKCGFLSHDYGKIYIMADDLDVPTIMKIGVSVRENERRNKVLKSAHKAGARIPDLQIVKTWEGPTEKIFEIESAMHKAFSNYKINFPVKFSGSNEFFYYRPEVFDMVEEAYKEIVCCQ